MGKMINSYKKDTRAYKSVSGSLLDTSIPRHAEEVRKHKYKVGLH